MQFTIKEGRIGEGKRVTVSVDNAEQARGLAIKRFPHAREISLYQLLSPGQKPEFIGQEYSRSWTWEPNIGWFRVLPGKRQTLSVAPDEATDKELVDKYLASLAQ